MSNATDKPRTAQPVIKETAKPALPSGRAKFDSRGNAVWEWQTEDGEFSTDVSTQRIKKLEAPELSIEETARLKKLGSAHSDTQGGGFNPYDNGSPRAPRDHHARDAGAKKPMLPPAKASAEPRKPVKDLKRLQEWMEMKKRLANQKDDD